MISCSKEIRCISLDITPLHVWERDRVARWPWKLGGILRLHPLCLMQGNWPSLALSSGKNVSHETTNVSAPMPSL